MRRASSRLVLLGFPVLAVLGGCGDDVASTTEHPVTVTVIKLPGHPSAGGTTLTGLGLVASDDTGHTRAGVDIALSVVAGGGSISPTTVTTDADGRATFAWTLGALPVMNVMEADAGDLGVFAAESEVDASSVLAPAAFGKVDDFLTAQAIEGSTEDLAFGPDGKLVMGVPGGLVALGADGAATRIATTGEALMRPLGLAYDAGGRLWVADGDADALLRVGTDRAVTKVADRDGVEPFVAPNDVAVGPDGRVYLSDTCTGKVYALTPDGAILARASFDAKTEGGPNGVVWGPDGALWVTTENTGLFCAHDDVVLTDPVAGLFRLPVNADGTFGARVAVATGVAVFGDGLAFDAYGNLYVIFDTIDGLSLDETIVFALPKGETTLRRAFAAKEKVWANLAFGEGAHGNTTMYLSLLATPPFTPASARGVERVKVDVEGAPLPPVP